MKAYSIRQAQRPGEHASTMIIRDNDSGEDQAEYRLTAGCERLEMAAMRREIDRHLASPNGTLGNYQW